MSRNGVLFYYFCVFSKKNILTIDLLEKDGLDGTQKKRNKNTQKNPI